jgi:hypothetical protein
MSRQALLEKIELCRYKMVTLAHSSCLSNQEVIEVSKELDRLLNQYEQYHKK